MSSRKNGLMLMTNPSLANLGVGLLPSDGRERGKRGYRDAAMHGLFSTEYVSSDARALYGPDSPPCPLHKEGSEPDGREQVFCFSMMADEHQKLASISGPSISFGDFDFGWLRADLDNLCQASLPLGEGKEALSVPFNSQVLLTDMKQLQKNGVILYFMGKVLKGFQLRAWAAGVGGQGCFSRFLFLGKGFYLGICADTSLKLDLLAQGGAWGKGFFALALPWHDSFDPMSAFLRFCPVWMTFKALPPILIPHIASVASKIGKVLFVPPLASFICSRTVTLCILWDMQKKIPGFIKLELERQQPLYIEVAVHSFPTACYKCKSVGHYARHCGRTEATPDSLKVSELEGPVSLEAASKDDAVTFVSHGKQPPTSHSKAMDVHVSPDVADSLDRVGECSSDPNMLNPLPQSMILQTPVDLDTPDQVSRLSSDSFCVGGTVGSHSVENSEGISLVVDPGSAPSHRGLEDSEPLEVSEVRSDFIDESNSHQEEQPQRAPCHSSNSLLQLHLSNGLKAKISKKKRYKLKKKLVALVSSSGDDT